jgi:hypothetical protein
MVVPIARREVQKADWLRSCRLEISHGTFEGFSKNQVLIMIVVGASIIVAVDIVGGVNLAKYVPIRVDQVKLQSTDAGSFPTSSISVDEIFQHIGDHLLQLSSAGRLPPPANGQFSRAAD